MLNILLGIVLGGIGTIFVLRNNPTLLAKLISDLPILEALYARVKTKLGISK